MSESSCMPLLSLFSLSFFHHLVFWWRRLGDGVDTAVVLPFILFSPAIFSATHSLQKQVFRRLLFSRNFVIPFLQEELGWSHQALSSSSSFPNGMVKSSSIRKMGIEGERENWNRETLERWRKKSWSSQQTFSVLLLHFPAYLDALVAAKQSGNCSAMTTTGEAFNSEIFCPISISIKTSLRAAPKKFFLARMPATTSPQHRLCGTPSPVFVRSRGTTVENQRTSCDEPPLPKSPSRARESPAHWVLSCCCGSYNNASLTPSQWSQSVMTSKVKTATATTLFAGSLSARLELIGGEKDGGGENSTFLMPSISQEEEEEGISHDCVSPSPLDDEVNRKQNFSDFFAHRALNFAKTVLEEWSRLCTPGLL